MMQKVSPRAIWGIACMVKHERLSLLTHETDPPLRLLREKLIRKAEHWLCGAGPPLMVYRHYLKWILYIVKTWSDYSYLKFSYCQVM